LEINENEVENLDKESLLLKKLTMIANYLETKYEGLAFIAPLKVDMNMTLIKKDIKSNDSSESSEMSDKYNDTENEKKFEFMKYVFSKNAAIIKKTIMKGIFKKIKKKGFKTPTLERSKVMLDVVISQLPKYISDCSKLNLPEGILSSNKTRTFPNV
jgi:hypothetical protein